jgi:NAD(P)-dependent dehydrogenase (short-subunit alcohol dehydrogenase family)
LPILPNIDRKAGAALSEPRSFSSVRWTPAQLPDLAKKVAVVTGGNSGIGYYTARRLAEHGARVVLAVRDPSAGETAAERVRTAARSADVDVADLDLASMHSIRAFGEAWDGPLHLLINNAGVMAPPRRTSTADGFELQFGTNHLGHFVLTGLLLPALAAAEDGGRVVVVSSIAHHGGDANVVEANSSGRYDAQRAYSNSKLANLLFAMQLHRELTDRRLPISATAAHPGVSATGLFSDRQGMGANPLMRTVAPAVMRVFTQSADAGARSTLYAATVAEPGSYTGPQWLGETRGPLGPARLSEHARDEKLARRLWQVSEELTGFRYRWPSADAQ